MSDTLLVVGATCVLGRRVAAIARDAGWNVVGTHFRSPLAIDGVEPLWLDSTDRAAVDAAFERYEPRAVVNAAIFPQLSGAGLWAVNVGGATNVALAAQRNGARLVHVSTDALFEGRDAPYTEADDPVPLNPYGASKAAAEAVVRAVAPGAVVVRTSLIIDDDPPDKHTHFILDIAVGRRSESLFTDEFRCPVAAPDLAAALVELAGNSFEGVLNVAGADAVSRYELGLLVAWRYGVAPERVRSTTLAATGLKRPARVVFDLSRSREVLRTRVRGAREFLSADQIVQKPPT